MSVRTSSSRHIICDRFHSRTHLRKTLVVNYAGAIKCLALLLLCLHRSAGQGPSGKHCDSLIH